MTWELGTAVLELLAWMMARGRFNSSMQTKCTRGEIAARGGLAR